ncbi:TR1L1 protein, partial [Crypturellus soui]|nr:TR1L1 protein [Crypturellus soui]
MGLRRKSRSPAVLSHEFVIQNHADAVSCLAVGFLLGLMFEVAAKYVVIFITVQYNVTYVADDQSEHVHFYDYGPKDIATIFFYMLIAIILHAVIQEYILDKINRHLHLSKTKHSKFNESGQLALFYLLSFTWGASILTAEEFMMNPTSLWKNYPHTPMLKCLHNHFEWVSLLTLPFYYVIVYMYIFLFYSLQHLGLILMVPHYLVELIFHASRLFYFSDENKQKGFTIWALLFVIARLLTLTLSVLTFGFGLARVKNPDFSIADGDFSVLAVRISCLTAICLTQAWMMWKFINFQLKKWREHVQNQIPKKKIINTKSKSTKKEPNRG